MTKKKQSISILGCGWLGLPLAERLIHLQFQIKGSTTTEAKLAQLKQKGIQAFLIDIETLPDHIQEFLQAEILIIGITTKKLEAYKALISEIALSPIKKVLFISSTSVYAKANQMLAEDSSLLNIDSPFLAIENLFINQLSWITTIIRFAGLIGPKRHPGRFFAQGKPISQPDAPVNLIHLNDSIHLIIEVIQQEAWREMFNACSDSHPSKREFYTRAARAYGAPLPNFIETDRLEYKMISNARVKEKLGLTFSDSQLMAERFFETCI